MVSFLISILCLFVNTSFGSTTNNLPLIVGNLSDSGVIHHSAFSLSYNHDFRQPNWVQYDLACSDLDNPVERTNDFRADFSVPGGTLNEFDYKYTGYDRGHIAPARDMARSLETMSDSFLMSNMSPQKAYFNRSGLWRKSENAVRYWACDKNKLTVIGGPVLTGELTQVGKLFVPKYFYKIVLADDFHAVAFIFENGNDKSSISKHVVSIDEIELLTGIDFFSDLPDDLENEIESYSDSSLWAFRNF